MIYIIIFCRNRKTQLSDLVGLGSDGCCVRLCHGGASSAPKDRALEHVFCQAVCHLTKRGMESSNLKTGREHLKKQHLGYTFEIIWVFQRFSIISLFLKFLARLDFCYSACFAQLVLLDGMFHIVSSSNSRDKLHVLPNFDLICEGVENALWSSVAASVCLHWFVLRWVLEFWPQTFQAPYRTHKFTTFHPLGLSGGNSTQVWNADLQTPEFWNMLKSVEALCKLSQIRDNKD